MKWYTTLVLALTFAVVGFEDKDLMEQAGEEIDEAVHNMHAGGETTANKVDDALDDVNKGMSRLTSPPFFAFTSTVGVL